MKTFWMLSALIGMAVLHIMPCGAEDTVHLAFLGDSITDSTYLPAEQRLDQVMQKKLKELYPKQKLECHNVAKSGGTIPKCMAEGGVYDTKVKTLHEIDVCLIQFGGNDEDICTPEEFKKNLEGLCDRVLADYPGVKIVLCTSTTNKSREWWEEHGMDAAEPINAKYYAKTRDLAKERGYPLLDIHAYMVEAFKKSDWDLRIRNQKLGLKNYNKVIVDASKDEERKADGKDWFNDEHLNPHGLDVISAGMVKALKTAYPDALPNEGKTKP